MPQDVIVASNRQIDLPRSSYRSARTPRWRRYLNCIRHPIHAFMAYRAIHPAPMSEREKTVLYAALVHGFVAWLVVTHS